jgi:hypothetical protein
MTKTVKNIKTLWAVAAATYKEWFAYRTHSLVSAFVGPAYFLVQVSIWRSVYAGAGSVGGISLDEMIAYYGIATLISYLTMDSADWNLQMLIRTGKYLSFALRPIHHRFFALSQKIGHRTLGFLFEFLPVLFIFVFVFRLRIHPAHWGFFLLSVALAYLAVFYLNYSIGLAGFWLVKTEGCLFRRPVSPQPASRGVSACFIFPAVPVHGLCPLHGVHREIQSWFVFHGRPADRWGAGGVCAGSPRIVRNTIPGRYEALHRGGRLK